MKLMKTARQLQGRHPLMTMERRSIPRAPVSFGLMYSGITGNDILMGDGRVVDLANGRLGIRGNNPVKSGMELPLFRYLPDGRDPLFILEAEVAWNAGHLFGVEFKKMSLREGNRL